LDSAETNDGETKELLRDFEFCDIKLSPNGSAVGIELYFEEYDFDNSTSYIIINNETKILGYNVNILGISDNGQHLYYEEDEIVYYQSGFNKDSRKELFFSPKDSYAWLEFNTDYSQAFYEKTDGENISTYLIIDGGEPMKIAD
jgi:hypothetical protein